MNHIHIILFYAIDDADYDDDNVQILHLPTPNDYYLKFVEKIKKSFNCYFIS